MRKSLMCTICFLAILLIVLMTTPLVGAKSISNTSYWGYEYNNYGESVAAPAGYVTDKAYSSADMGLQEAMNAPTDMFYDGREFLYVLDSGNGRILQLDANMKLVQTYGNFVTESGEEVSIEGAQGFALDPDGDFYIANTLQKQVLRINRDCMVTLTIGMPQDVQLDTEADFKAKKVLVDENNKIYVLVENINVGAFVFHENGEFDKFFGSNPIVKTYEVIQDYLLKRFMTKEQRKGVERIVPTMFNNFDIDARGFLCTVTATGGGTTGTDSVRLLNYKGESFLTETAAFGDLEWDRLMVESKYTSFIDVDIDSQGFINLLDNSRGRVFQYTMDGDLIAAFGTTGDQVGGVTEPIAVETIGDKVYVLDNNKNNITCFTPSRYGLDLRAAFLLADGTNYEGATEAWNKVLVQNTNSQYPYYGIGMALDSKGEYKEAMRYFKLAGAQEEYSKSFREYRKIFINQNFTIMLFGVLAVAAVIVLLARVIKKRFAATHGEAYSVLETKYTFPLYTILHPSDGFDQFKSRDIASYRLSLGIMISWFLLSTLKFFGTAFTFNNSRPMDYDFFVVFMSSTGLLLLFIASNWSVCTLFNGNGSLKEIASVCSYSLVPYLVALLTNTVLSNVLALEEQAFLQIISFVGIVWSVIILFVGLQAIHQYNFTQTLLSVLSTLIGMVVIAFLCVLFLTLLKQTVNFVWSLISELSLR